MIRKVLPAILTLLILGSVAGQAGAAFVTFNDRTSFLAATGASSATGILPNIGRVPGDSTTINGVTITEGPLATALFIGTLNVSGAGPDWTPLIPGHDIALSAPEDLDVGFSAPVFSAGFDFVEPDATSDGEGCNATCFDSDFSVRLLLGAAEVGLFSFNAPDNVLAFIGVWSDSAFDRLEIRDETAEIDNEYFGQFYTGTRALSEVPVPAGIWLFATALIGFVGYSRRRIIG